MIKAYIIRITGVVQGVGFRPFVYRLARRFNLNGYVRNLGGAEVEIYIEGDSALVKKFLVSLRGEKPPSAILDKVEIVEVMPKHINGFTILQSSIKRSSISMIPPDFSICEYCIKDITNPNSRFYRYPFHSCAWCGPRFTIIEKLPYDRKNTSMRDFPLCNTCLKEFKDPNNLRRFHAQGISCPSCGPKLSLLDKDGNPIHTDDPIKEVAELIDEGNIVAIKGIGGFHIAALATDDDIVIELRRRKRRPTKPFALMALNLEVAKKIVVINELIEELLTSLSRPIVVCEKRTPSVVSEYVAPGLNTLGVMLAYSGIHYLLLQEVKDKFLIMTSGNPPGMPICKDEKEALVKLKNIVDFFLIHNRRIINRIDDSVIRISLGIPQFLRRARGYVPLWIKSPFKARRPIIALGALLSNVASIQLGDKVIPTQYLGDVDNLESLNFLKESIGFLLNAYNVKLDSNTIIVADMHPAYLTRRYAEELSSKLNCNLLLVQHHHAHIASVMAENGIKDERVVGIAIDGLGYSSDKTLWGGEVMIADYFTFNRYGHIEYNLLPGGDMATRYPIRMLASILSKVMPIDGIKDFLISRGYYKMLPRGLRELDILTRIIELKKAPLTSSMGRVLDAMSALLGVCHTRTYEGEPAIKLEEFSKGGEIIDDLFKIDITEDMKGHFVINVSNAFKKAISLMDEVDLRSIAKSFQYALGSAFGRVAIAAKRRGIDKLVISGGASVNEIILRGILDTIADRYAVLRPRNMPAGDGGICLGQATIAVARDLYGN